MELPEMQEPRRRGATTDMAGGRGSRDPSRASSPVPRGRGLCLGFLNTDTALVAVLGPFLYYWALWPYEGSLGGSGAFGYALGVVAIFTAWGFHATRCQRCRILANDRADRG